MAENLTKIYLNYHDQFTTQYGPKTLVLIQCGSFYECYGTKTRGPNIKKIGELLNITATKKSKQIETIDETNPELCGFPSISKQKFLKVLIDNGYTVVVIDQITPPPKPKRQVTGVYSAGTYIPEGSIHPDANYIVSLYIEDEEQMKQKPLTCVGMSAIDLSTGVCYIHEAHSLASDDKFAIDEAKRFIYTLDPKELIVYIQTVKLEEKIIEQLEFGTRSYKIKQLDKKFTKLNYQNEILKTVYNNHGLLSPLEYLDLDRKPYSTIAYVCLLDYSYQHNHSIIKKLHKPSVFSDERYMLLGNNAIDQLNVLSSNQYTTQSSIKSLFDVINKTTTVLGRRFLKSRLLFPLVNKKELDKSYGCIEYLRKNFKKYVEQLKYITDIERLYRKIVLETIQPFELHEFLTSFEAILTLIVLCENTVLAEYVPDKLQIQELITSANELFVMDILKKSNITEPDNFIQKGLFPELDELDRNINSDTTMMDSLAKGLSQLIDGAKINISHNSKDGYYLSGTSKRIKALVDVIKQKNEIQIEKYTIHADHIRIKEQQAGTTKLFLPELGDTSDNLTELTCDRDRYVYLHYKTFITKIANTYESMIHSSVRFVSYIDFYVSGARSSLKNNYKKPIITENDHSYIKCRNLRHPIIEQLINYPFVAQNVDLGIDTKGMLLYGYNGAGKSSYMKSVGLAIIMAQAGLYTAGHCELTPYLSLYARITSTDNLFQGLSSFSMEMMELRAILQRANTKNSICLGDEICKTTETNSATSIIATAIMKLASSNSCFIFATHLHDIPNIPEVKAFQNIKTFHLTVEYDFTKDILVYDRQLKCGSGPSDYGITVAQYILKDDDFIKTATQIKNRLIGQPSELVTYKQSKYNSKVIVYKCSLCESCFNLDTHHLIHQAECSNGFAIEADHIQMNSQANLAVLCKDCHQKLHTTNTDMKYTFTSNGRILVKTDE